MELIKKILSKFIKPKYGWHGDYKSWEEALKGNKGYNDEEIFKKVISSALMVKNGLAIYDRDSVIFNEESYNWPLITHLLYIHSLEKELNIIDFGGALGSSFFQHKKFLNSLKLQWNIVEQSKLVEAGRKHLEEKIINFYENINEIKVNTNCLLLNSVLPYIPQPYLLLNDLLNRKFKYVLIIDTPLIKETQKEYITLHKVNPSIYKAIIPTHILSYDKIKETIEKKGYKLFTSTISSNYFIYQRKKIYLYSLIFELT